MTNNLALICTNVLQLITKTLNIHFEANRAVLAMLQSTYLCRCLIRAQSNYPRTRSSFSQVWADFWQIYPTSLLLKQEHEEEKVSRANTLCKQWLLLLRQRQFYWNWRATSCWGQVHPLWASQETHRLVWSGEVNTFQVTDDHNHWSPLLLVILKANQYLTLKKLIIIIFFFSDYAAGVRPCIDQQSLVAMQKCNAPSTPTLWTNP